MVKSTWRVENKRELVTVTCRGRRFIAIVRSNLPSTKGTLYIAIRSEVANSTMIGGNLYDESPDVSTWPCINHPDGHAVDREALRRVFESRTPTTNMPLYVDVLRVEAESP